MQQQSLTVVKIGGNIIDDENALDAFLVNFNLLAGKKILIHGGGKLASKLAQSMGIVTQMHQGRRITDKDSLQVVTMVYAGWINKSIVAKLQAQNCNALGLSGADGNVIQSIKRAPQPIDFGYVGDVEPNLIELQFIKQLLQQKICPVFCSITHDKNGNLLNTNADSIAMVLALSLAQDYQVKLCYCFEKTGVLQDINDASSFLAQLDWASYQKLTQQGLIHSGMLPKLNNAFYAVNNGVQQVKIMHADNLLTQIGTTIIAKSSNEDQENNNS